MFKEQQQGTAPRHWPEGRLSGKDDGELAFKIGPDESNTVVQLDFPKPVTFLAMPPAQAIQLAQLLIKHARAISTEPLRIVIN